MVFAPLLVVGTVIFTALTGAMLFDQARHIWETRSGEALAVNWFAYPCFFYASFIVYGIYAEIPVVIFNGLLFFLYIPLLIGLWKFKGFTKFEQVMLFVFVAMVPAMALLPWKDVLLVIFSGGLIYSEASEVIELWHAETRGVLQLKLPLVDFFGTMLWVVYAALLENFALLFISVCTLMLLGTTLVLWFTKPAAAHTG